MYSLKDIYFIFNVCYIPFIPLSSKSSAEEMSYFYFLPPVRKKVISSGKKINPEFKEQRCSNKPTTAI